MDVFETAIREVAYVAVLATGALCLIGGAFAVGVWALKRMLRMFGLYKEFGAFVRSRRKR